MVASCLIHPVDVGTRVHSRTRYLIYRCRREFASPRKSLLITYISRDVAISKSTRAAFSKPLALRLPGATSSAATRRYRILQAWRALKARFSARLARVYSSVRFIIQRPGEEAAGSRVSQARKYSRGLRERPGARARALALIGT